MRIWLIGAGGIGTAALRQLHKNPDIEIVISDPTNQPDAVEQGLIEAVDLVENVSPVNINDIARRIRPDLILLSPSASERGLGSLEGGQALTDALNYEMVSKSDYPVLILSKSNSG